MDGDYSGRSVLQKLGIKPTDRICLIDIPGDYTSKVFEGNAYEFDTTPIDTYDFIHYFSEDKKLLHERLSELKSHLKKTGALWISWRKKGTGPTTITENDVMTVGLTHGLVDTKVIRFDDTWSALKFVYRIKDRSS